MAAVATIDMGRKEVGRLLCPFGGRGAGFLSNTMWPGPRSTSEVYFRTKWHLHPLRRLATIDIGRKLGAVSLLGGAETHVIQRCLGRGLPPYQVQSGILVHPPVWPQRTLVENWGCCAPLAEGKLLQTVAQKYNKFCYSSFAII